MQHWQTLSNWVGFFAGIIGVIVSEALGKGRVLYARLSLLFLSAVVSLAVLNYLLPEFKISMELLFLQVISLGAFLLSWFGFRTHLSNSITLHLLKILKTTSSHQSLNIQEMKSAYKVTERIQARILALQEAGYLERSPEQNTVLHWKTKLVLFLLRCVRGNRLGTFT